LQDKLKSVFSESIDPSLGGVMTRSVEPDTEQFKRWKSHGCLMRHRKETPLMRRYIQTKLRMGYSPEDLLAVIDNYARLVQAGAAPGYGKWSLTELMRNTVYFDNLLDDNWDGFEIKGKEKPSWMADEPVWPSRREE
jgi:hypothetical protein